MQASIKRRATTFDDVSDDFSLVDVVVSTGCFVAREEQNDRGEWELFERGLEISPDAIRLDRLKSGAPVLNNHHDGSTGERFSVSDVIGRVENAWIEEGENGPLLMATLRLSKISPEEREICKKVEAGIIRAVSVGAQVYSEEPVDDSPEGTKRFMATDWEPHEVSLVGIPADYDSIIRSNNKDKLRYFLNVNFNKDKAMGKKKKAAESSKMTKLEALDALFNSLTDDERALFLETRQEGEDEEKENEEDRVAEAPAETRQEEPELEESDLADAAMEAADAAVEALPEEVPAEVADDVMAVVEEALESDLAPMLEAGAGEEEMASTDPDVLNSLKKRMARSMKKKLYAKQISTKIKRNMRASHDGSHEKAQADNLREMATSSIACRITRGKHHAEKAGWMKGMRTMDICRHLLHYAGQRDAYKIDKNEVYRRVRMPLHEKRASGPIMATADLANLIESSATKAVTSSYEQFRGEQTFTPFVSQVSVEDFKTLDRVGISDSGALKETKPGAAYEIDSLDDSKETYQLATYAKMFQITRQTFVTDDTNELSQIFSSGKSAADLESDLVYGQVTGGQIGGSTIYSTARGTLNATTPFVPADRETPGYDYNGLVVMMTAFRNRTGPKGSKLNLNLGYVLVPSELHFAASQAVNGSYTPSSPQAANTMFTGLTVISDPRLSDNSTSTYYGVAKEASSVYPWIELATLQGASGPMLEQEVDFSTDVLRWKIVHDCAAKVLDFRLAHRCTA